MNNLLSPSVLMRPDKLGFPINWAGHIPFAFWLIENLKPDLLVELGTHSGNSYFAFCQAIASNQLPTRCFAVDTWKGDEHASFYEGAVFQEVSRYNEQNYRSFSKLLRSTFDEAVSQFKDSSIDLLHIDGLHTYEAVKHDFDTWRSKVSSRGIILFHDTAVKERGFGVWQLWEEIVPQYRHFKFDHSYGLGVLFAGEHQPPAVVELLKQCETKPGEFMVKQIFSRLGKCIELEYEVAKEQEMKRHRRSRWYRKIFSKAQR